ncbi:YadA-like family protein [Paraburkholderia sacchari]|uniref:YadA-like family protein n=1 Tax=Paraburkholderia sacchari TaxID=159450 RepID=UPI003D977725
MNKAYRVVWNETTGSWVAASELAVGRKKGASRKAKLLSAISSIALAALTFGAALPETALAGTNVSNGLALQGSTSGTTNDYYQYLYRNSNYAPTKGWDNQYALGAFVSIGMYAYTGVNKADDAIFKLDGYSANGRGGGVALGDSATVTGETGVALGAHSSATRSFSMAMGGNAMASGLGGIATGRESLASGNYSIATGFVATASGTGAISMGQSANASGLRSIAIGTSNQLSAAGNTAADGALLTNAANATGTDAVSIGTNAASGGDNSIALGLQAATTAAGTNGVAVGNGATVSANNGIAIGVGAQATGTSALSVGTGNKVSGNNSGAFGDPNTITGNSSYAVGNNSTISGDNSLAFGNSNTVNGANSAVVGSNGTVAAGQTDVLALGNNITSTASNSVVLGSNSGTTRANTVAVGSSTAQRQVVNMAAGTSSTDAVNVAQLTPVVNALGGNASFNASTGAVTGPNYTLTNANGIVGSSGSLGDVGSAMNRLDSALGKVNAVANQGWNVSVNGGTVQNVAPGATMNFKNGANTTVSVDASNNVTYGVVDNPTFAGTVTANGGLTVGAGQTVSMGGNKITNVASGSADTDAVNMSQLNATNANVAANTTDIATNASNIATNTADIATNASNITRVEGKADQSGSAVASALGGGAAYNATTGAISAPSYAVQGSTYGNVGAALGSLDTAVTGNTNSISDITNQLNSGTVGLVQQAAAGADLTVGKDTDGVAVDLADKAGNTRTLKSVTAGVADTDAVNMSQLNATNANVATNASNIATNTADIATNASNITRVEGKADQSGSAVASALGGGAAYNATTGAISAPSYAVQGSTYGNVGAALGSLDTAVTGNTNSISDITNQLNSGTVGLVQQAAAGADLTVGKDTDGVAVDLADKAGNTRTLKNVTAGAADTDAVNMSQLNATNANVATNAANIATNTADIATNASNITRVEGKADQSGSAVASALGGGAAYNATTGAISAPSYAVQGSTYGNVGAALGSLDTAVTGNTNSISDITNQLNSGTVGLVQQAAAGADLTVGKDTDGVAVDLADKAGNTRTLKNVTAGVADTDAVNMSQLNATNTNVAHNASDIANLQGSVANLDGRVTQNTSDIATINSNLTNMNGSMANALMYDSPAHASVTLGGAGAASPVMLRNVAAGTLSASSTDAVNGSQLYATNAQVSSNTAAITSLDTRVTQNTADITSLTTSINNGEVGLVKQDAATHTITVAKTSDGTTVDFAGVAGTRTLTGVSAGAVNASSTDAVNGSQLYNVAGSMASALGGGSTVNADGTITGPTYHVGGNTFTDMGSALTNVDGRVSSIETQVANVTGAAANSVQYDSPDHNKVTMGGTDATSTVQLTNLADGVLSQTSTDAVTGAQLYRTNQDVANLMGAVENISNTSSPYMAVNTTGRRASATGAESLAQGGGATAAGASSTAIGDKATAMGDNSVALGANSVANDSNTVSVGSQGNERRITNVAPGQGPTDAVNMGQLQSGMNSLQNGVNSVARNAYSGVAAATALTMIPDVDPGKTIAVGVSTANYKGYQAAALGLSARVSDNLKLKAGAGYSAGGGSTVGAGMSYQW